MKLKQKMFMKIFIKAKNSMFFDPVNKKVIGKKKDELKGEIISEFFGLKSKMYSLIAVDDEEVTKAKGENKIRHKEFVDVLLKKSDKT